MTKIYLVIKEYSNDPYSDKTCTVVVTAYATSQAANECATELRNESRKRNWRHVLGYEVEEVDFENR